MQIPQFEFIRLTLAGGVAALEFARPEFRNALNERMMAEIGAAVGWLADAPDIRVLVLRGAGGHFCAGGDLNTMRDLPPLTPDGTDPERDRYRRFGEVLSRLDQLPQAVIAVVEGTCVGGGFGMAACADLVIAGVGARFGLPEPRQGFIPSQIVPFLVRRLGESAVRRIAVTASVIDATEARHLGMVDVLVPDADVDAALSRELANLQKAAPQAVAAIKGLIQSCRDAPLETVLDAGVTKLLDALRGPEASEGIEAFLTKRAPSWTRDR